MAKNREATTAKIPQSFNKLLKSEGGLINPDALRKKGLLLSVSGNGEYLYPIWQFERPVYPNLRTILKELRDGNNNLKIAFFLTPNARLNNMTPLQALRKGWVGKVVMAARNIGDQTIHKK